MAAKTVGEFLSEFDDDKKRFPTWQEVLDAAIASVEGVRERAHNKPSTPCPACGRDMECANGCQSQHRSGVVLM